MTLNPQSFESELFRRLIDIMVNIQKVYINGLRAGAGKLPDMTIEEFQKHPYKIASPIIKLISEMDVYIITETVKSIANDIDKYIIANSNKDNASLANFKRALMISRDGIISRMGKSCGKTVEDILGEKR